MIQKHLTSILTIIIYSQQHKAKCSIFPCLNCITKTFPASQQRPTYHNTPGFPILYYVTMKQKYFLMDKQTNKVLTHL